MNFNRIKELLKHDRCNDTKAQQQTLTEAAKLADNVSQADIGDTFQLTANVGRDGLSTHMSRLDISRDQRHGGVLRGGGPNPTGERERGHASLGYLDEFKRKRSKRCITM